MTRRIIQDRTIPVLPTFTAWLMAQGNDQATIADRIGVTQRCVSYWLTHQRWPTVESLRLRPDGLRALAEDLEEANGHR